MESHELVRSTGPTQSHRLVFLRRASTLFSLLRDDSVVDVAFGKVLPGHVGAIVAVEQDSLDIEE